jgi:hypothetical protein
MKRRTFVALIGSAAIVQPLGARAQPKVSPVIGFLCAESSAPWAPFVAAFRQGLNETGYVEPVLRPTREHLEDDEGTWRSKAQSHAGEYFLVTCRRYGPVLERKRAKGDIEWNCIGCAQQEHTMLEREFARILDARREAAEQFVDVARLAADSGEYGQVGNAGEPGLPPVLYGNAADKAETLSTVPLRLKLLLLCADEVMQ